MFELGEIVATPGAIEAFEQAYGNHPAIVQFYMGVFLGRHQSGDWGEVPPEDAEENWFSVKNGLRVLSSYTLKTGVKVWVITESDRSATTILLPSEY